MGINNNFSAFDPSVWGTVSDWLMVLVTAITAVYLYKTFKSQQELTRIEQFRHRENLKPSFTMDTSIAEDKSTDLHRIYLVKIQLTAKDNTAYNVDLSKTSYTMGFQFTSNFKKKFLVRKDNSIVIHVTYRSKINESDLYMGQIEFLIQYTDSDDNLYNQEVHFKMVNRQHFKTIKLPKFTSIANKDLRRSVN